MKTIEFRQAGPADEPFLEDVTRLAMGWRDGTSPPLTPLTDRYVRGYGRPGDHGIVALLDGARVGAAWWRLFSADNRGYGYIRDDVPELTLGVQQQARRRGIATTLLNRLLADAVPRGCRR